MCVSLASVLPTLSTLSLLAHTYRQRAKSDGSTVLLIARCFVVHGPRRYSNTAAPYPRHPPPVAGRGASVTSSRGRLFCRKGIGWGASSPLTASLEASPRAPALLLHTHTPSPTTRTRTKNPVISTRARARVTRQQSDSAAAAHVCSPARGATDRPGYHTHLPPPPPPPLRSVTD